MGTDVASATILRYTNAQEETMTTTKEAREIRPPSR